MKQTPRSPASSPLSWIAVSFLLGLETAQSENLLPNPDADSDSSGWSFPFGGSWEAEEDADGCETAPAGSGSLLAPSVNVLGDSYAGVESDVCVEVTPGETLYTQIAYISPEAADGLPQYYALPACGGGATTVPFGDGGGMLPVVDWTVYSESFVVPDGFVSLGIGWVALDLGGSAFVTRWDRAYLGRRARIFADDFEAGSPCRWSATVDTADVPALGD